MTKIVSVLYDDIPENLNDIRNNLIDLTKFKMQGMLPIDIIKTNKLSDSLDKITPDVDWAVVIAAGHYLEGQYLIQETVDHAIKENVPLACHILAKGGYFHFHQQWFAIHLPTWRAVGSPRFEESRGRALTVKETVRDPNNVHDDYTPWWLKPGDSDKTYRTDHGYFGLNVVEALINHNHAITNIPQNIRNRKCYPYPDANHQEIREMINNPKKEFPKETTNSSVWWFKQLLDRLTDQLDRGFYVLNTEPITLNSRVDNAKFDCFVGVCGGIKPACIVGRDNFIAQSSVHLFDISDAALDWQKYLIEHWDGDFSTFESVFKSFMDKNPGYYPMYHSHLSIEENIAWYFKSGNLTKEEFQIRWNKYRTSEFNFHKLDLLAPDAADQILSLIGDKKCCYLWASNAFSMDYLMFYKTEKGSELIGETFKRTLQNKSSIEIFYEECNQIKYIRPVGNC
jgi:hypothetical protein